MRTRNTVPTKSGGAKKTPPVEKDASAEKIPETTPKSTPKSGAKSARSAGKQSASKAAAAAAAAAAASPACAAATSDAKPEPKVEEVVTSADEKKLASAMRSPTEKKAGGKAKSPLGGKVAAAAAKVEDAVEESAPSKVEDAMEEPQPEAEEQDASREEELKVDTVLDVNSELEGNPVKNEEEEEEAAGDQQMEEGEPESFQEPESFREPGDEEYVGGEEDAAGGQGTDAVTGEEEEEGARVEEEEQIEISYMSKKSKMKKEQEIFVGGLDRDAVEDDLKKVFEKVGEVVEVRLHKDFGTNKNKGFAFVKFANKEQAVKALSELKNPVIRGKRCGIAPSEDNDTLFLGNVCNTWTKEAIRRKLKDYGIDGVESITLVADTQNEGLSRGFAFLEFSCHAEAMLAYKRLLKPDAIFGHPERTAKVAFAEPLREPDPEVMAQVKSVFVDGLPPYWDEDCVKEQFKGFGEIERVVLARNMSTAKRKDFGFVNFTTHEAAVACVESMNNTELGNGKSKMKARVRLANPLPKIQAVKGGMSGGFRIGHTSMGVYSRFGRGFGRARYFSQGAGFQRGRGFNFRGRGRGGRFSFSAEDNPEIPPSEFHGRRPFGFRGGGRLSTSARHGAYDRGRGRAFPSRRPPYIPEEFGGPFGARHLGEDPYFYGDGGRGIKRPFSMMEHDPGYLEPGPRMRPRFDHPDPLAGGSRNQDLMGLGGLYSHDYYGSDYGGSTYSSLYGGEHSGGGYYY